MQPRLFAIAGPLKNSTLPLLERELALGRERIDASCHVDLSDVDVSNVDLSIDRSATGPSVGEPLSIDPSFMGASILEKHCRLRQVDGRFQILNLESGNRTMVNGRSVQQEWLNHGDEIAVGDSVFVFLMEEGHSKESPAPHRMDGTLLGDGVRMRELDQLLMRVAPADSTVLIEGESGTGKELAARALHRHSARAKQPFVAINCAAIPDALLEDDLFGHERGAFTGAVGPKKGRLEVADGGVVFLDEIGELAPLLQVKLLRVLQEREFERLGGTRPIKVNIRLVAATNCDLDEAVRTGKFRQDLYYRLAVVKLRMPSLRERKEDIPLLASHFVHKYSKRCKVKAKLISPDTIGCLSNHDWPGNVRELENAIEHALVLGHSEVVRPADLPESVLEHWSSPEKQDGHYHSRVKELKKQLIVEAVEQTRGNYVEAAGILGVHPNYLHRLIRNLGLKEFLKRDLLNDGSHEESRTGHGRLSRASHGAA
ncbi:MAG TPA: sigma 54-interacting transcriptional regulator [Candidatus Sulfotelmatobacter sp.]